ncbi:MAG: hypothetical protein WC614_09335 [bacterium]
MNFNPIQKQSLIKNTALLFIALLLLSGCAAPKKFLWKGDYVAFNTAEQPKEDFKAGDYIVISYAPIDSNPKAKIPYKFAFVEGNKQIGLLVVKPTPKNKKSTEYSLVEPIKERIRGAPIGFYRLSPLSFSPYDRGLATTSHSYDEPCKNYVQMPDYETLKNDIITALSDIPFYENIDTTTEKPKEYFPAGRYTIISYVPKDLKLNDNESILYKFAVTLENKQLAKFLLIYYSEIKRASLVTVIKLHKTLYPGYFSNLFRSPYSSFITCTTYAATPDYDTVKNEIITMLSCEPTGASIDPSIEKSKETFQTGDYTVTSYEYSEDSDILYKFAIFKENEQVGVIVLEHHKGNKFHDLGYVEYFLEETGVRRSGAIPYITASLNHATYKEYLIQPSDEDIKNYEKNVFPIPHPDYETVKNDVISVLSGKLPE